jgi:hypothetical protein
LITNIAGEFPFLRFLADSMERMKVVTGKPTLLLSSAVIFVLASFVRPVSDPHRYQYQ